MIQNICKKWIPHLQSSLVNVFPDHIFKICMTVCHHLYRFFLSAIPSNALSPAIATNWREARMHTTSGWQIALLSDFVNTPRQLVNPKVPRSMSLFNILQNKMQITSHLMNTGRQSTISVRHAALTSLSLEKWKRLIGTPST